MYYIMVISKYTKTKIEPDRYANKGVKTFSGVTAMSGARFGFFRPRNKDIQRRAKGTGRERNSYKGWSMMWGSMTYEILR